MGLYEEADKSSAYLVRSVNNQYAGFSRLTPDYMNTTAAGVISKGPRCEGQAVWKAANGSYWLLGSHLTGWHANEAILARSDSPALEGATWTVAGNPSHSLTTYDSQSTYVLPVRTPKGKLLLYMGDRWNEGSESAPGSVGGASYIWLPMLHNRSDPTGYSMPILGGQWNGTGRWRISDYLLPD